MSNNKNKKNKPPPIDSKPSVAISQQDKLNQKLLSLRLKKEEEAEVRKLRAQEKSNKQKSRLSIEPKRVSIPPLTIGNWNIPFSTASQSQQNSVQPSANIPVNNEVKPSQTKTILASKSKPSSMFQVEVVDEEEFETPSIILLSKPGSRNIVKTIAIEPLVTPATQFQPEDAKTDRSTKSGQNPEKIMSSPADLDPDNGTSNELQIVGFGSSMMANLPDLFRHSDRPIAITRAGEERYQLEQRLISNNKTAKHKVNESLLNVLKSGKDEAMHVTIIPADEAKVLELELKQWRTHRVAFIILFGLAMIMGLAIVTLTLFASINYFLVKAQKYDEETHEANRDFLLHTDFMIIGSVFLSAVGLLVFRLLPQVKKFIVIRIHLAIVSITYVLFIYGFGVAVQTHSKVTGRPEHFYTIHSMVGLMICLFLLFEIGTGVYAMIQPTGPATKYHSAVGMMTFMLCGACSVSGYLVRSMLFTEGVKQHNTIKNVVNNSTGVLIIIFCCLVRYIAAEFRFRRRAQPQWDTVFSRSMTTLEDVNIDREGCTLQQYVRRNAIPRKK